MLSHQFLCFIGISGKQCIYDFQMFQIAGVGTQEAVRASAVYLLNTGDNSHLGMWAGLMAVSLIVLIAAAALGRKYGTDRN